MGTLAGWAYRKAITINHTGDGAQTNYQMKLSLVKGVSGTYVNTGGTITTVGANTIHTFTANDNFYAGKTGIVNVECWGAGGGGAYVSGSGGGGGGGGAYAATPDVAVTATTSYAVVRGTGGARDTAGVAASSTFAATTVVALGGTGVSGTTGGAGGVGASGTGTTKNSGGAGKNADANHDSGGGAGGAGGPDGAGADGTAAAHEVGGAGGAGDAGSGGTAGVAGNPGGVGGASAKGGGGGAGNHADTYAGGNGGLPGGGGAGTDNSGVGATGANGQVVITCVTADFLTADYAGVTYLENHCLNWPTDILFTLSDGTTTAGADFWGEESDATDGTWWLEADSIPAHPDDFHGYVYYGKADEADASSGANTFIEYNDCSSLDGWTYPADVSIDTGRIKVVGAAGAKYIYRGSGYGDGIGIYCTWSCADIGDNYDRGGVLEYIDASNWLVAVREYNSGQALETDRMVAGGYDSKSAASVITSGWARLLRDGDSAIGGVSADGVTWTQTAAVAYALTNNSVGFTVGDTCTFYFDNFFVRNYTTNEPTWAASGAEEALWFPRVNVYPHILAH